MPSPVRQHVFFTAGENKKLEYWYYIQCLNVCTHLYQTLSGHVRPAAQSAHGRLRHAEQNPAIVTGWPVVAPHPHPGTMRRPHHSL